MKQKTNQEYYHLRIVEPSLENVFTNHRQFEIKNCVGNPRDKNEALHYKSSFVDCGFCGALIALDKTIVIRYGTAKYMRAIFCLNCFHAYFPKYKQWLINHFKWYEKRFIARYFHVCPNWKDITLRSDVFFQKCFFPNVPTKSPYSEKDVAKTINDFERKLPVHHDWLFQDEIKARCEKCGNPLKTDGTVVEGFTPCSNCKSYTHMVK
jgi:hypothetical protein